VAQKYVHFDLYLNGVGAQGLSRAELVKRIEALYRLDPQDSAAFVLGGKRIRVRRGIDQDAAMKSILELQGVGAIVEIEPNRPPDEALAALDAIDDLGEQPPAIDAQNVEVQALRTALKGMSGGFAPVRPNKNIDRDAPTEAAERYKRLDSARLDTGTGTSPGTGTGDIPTDPSREGTLDRTTAPRVPISLDIPTDPNALQSLDGNAMPLSLDGGVPALDAVKPAVPLKSDAHAADSSEVTIGRESTAETNPAHDTRFQAPDYEERPMLLDVVAPTAAPPQQATMAEDEPPPTCGEHDLPEPCKACADRDAPKPGRIMQGALRKQPAVRIGVGVVLGLLLGYLASMPYADRAERRVAAVRAEANEDRYKNAPEARENCARLDAQAEQMSRNAAIGTIAIWLVVGGGVVAGWFRLT
jgi:hypothetical protein